MFADLAFFSFVDLADPTQHRAYNEWHQLDHQPENLALPGVAWGGRWARRAELLDDSAADATFEGVDYVAMYWFRPPVAESVAAWDQLGEDSFQWGRGPLIPGVRRRLLAFFRPVKGYVRASALVSPEVLPFRPQRGIHFTITRHPEPHAAGTHEQHAWVDRSLMPQLLEVEGVAGGWTFSFVRHQQHSSLPFDAEGQEKPGSLRIRMLYLDGDPRETSRAVSAAEQRAAAAPDAPAVGTGEVLLAGPLTTIVPWQDW